MAHRGSRGIAVLFLDHATRREWGVSVTLRPLFIPRKYPVPIVQEAGWAPGPVWICAENLAPTRIRSPDRPACSQSLYRVCYPAHQIQSCTLIILYSSIRIVWRKKYIWTFFLEIEFRSRRQPTTKPGRAMYRKMIAAFYREARFNTNAVCEKPAVFFSIKLSIKTGSTQDIT